MKHYCSRSSVKSTIIPRYEIWTAWMQGSDDVAGHGNISNKI